MANNFRINNGDLAEHVGELSEIVTSVNASLENIVRKGEGGVVTPAMASQELKEMMTGGSVAIVGKDTILTENIIDNQVTYEKTSFLKTKYINKVNPAKIVQGSQGTNGILQGTAGYTTELIEVVEGKEYIGNLIGVSGVWSSWFLNANKSPVSVIPSLNFTVPSGIKYVRITYPSSTSKPPEYYNFMLVEGSVLPDLYIPYIPTISLDKPLENKINNMINTEISLKEQVLKASYYNLLTGIEVYNKYCIERETGKLLSYNNANAYATNFIQIEIENYQTNGITAFGAFGCAIYDENKKFISSIPIVNKIISITEPSAKYIRLSFYTTEPLYFMLASDSINNVNKKKAIFSDAEYKESLKREMGITAGGGELQGLTWNVLGDSITYAYAGTGKRSYHSIIGDKYGVFANNYGSNGSRICFDGVYSEGNEMCTRYATMTDNAEIITVMGGINDLNNKLTLGTFNDRIKTTFYGALHILCEGLHKKYIGKRIGFITPMQYSGSGEEYINAIKEVCKYYSIPVLDLWTNGLLTSRVAEVNTALFVDGLHPSEQGHDVLARKIYQFLLTL